MSTMMQRSAWVTEPGETLEGDALEQRRGRWSEPEQGYEALFRALDRSIELVCDDTTQNAISDLYIHLIGDCDPKFCDICAEQASAEVARPATATAKIRAAKESK